MKDDGYLPVWVNHLPAAFAFDALGNLKPAIRDYVRQGVVRVVAGPLAVHLCVDVQRPYFRPRSTVEADIVEGREIVQ
jgi:hypothetical protein